MKWLTLDKDKFDVDLWRNGETHELELVVRHKESKERISMNFEKLKLWVEISTNGINK